MQLVRKAQASHAVMHSCLARLAGGQPHLHRLACGQLELQQFLVLAVYALKVLLVFNLELLKVNQVQDLQGTRWQACSAVVTVCSGPAVRN